MTDRALEVARLVLDALNDAKLLVMRETHNAGGRTGAECAPSPLVRDIIAAALRREVGGRRRIDGKFHVEGSRIIKTSSGEEVPESEATLLLRGRDRLALPLLEHYRKLCEADGCNDYQLGLVDDIIAEFETYKMSNPTKQPGVTRGAVWVPPTPTPQPDGACEAWCTSCGMRGFVTNERSRCCDAPVEGFLDKKLREDPEYRKVYEEELRKSYTESPPLQPPTPDAEGLAEKLVNALNDADLFVADSRKNFVDETQWQPVLARAIEAEGVEDAAKARRELTASYMRAEKRMADEILDTRKARDEARAQLAEWEATAELMRTRERPWIERWRKETGNPDVLPDYGRMLAWLVTKLDEARAQLRVLEGTDDHPEHRCGNCRGRNVVWFAESPLWNAVVRNIEPPLPEVLCPICFVRAAEERGVVKGAWRLAPADDGDECGSIRVQLHAERDKYRELQEAGRQLVKGYHECRVISAPDHACRECVGKDGSLVRDDFLCAIHALRALTMEQAKPNRDEDAT